jgi:5'-nucleotidase
VKKFENEVIAVARFTELTLLHSNDMHGDFLAAEMDSALIGGLSMLSGYIRSAKEERANTLFCIAGDMLQGSLIDYEFKGLSTIEMMNLLAPDIASLGNHEVDYGLAHLLFLERCATFPIVNANLYVRNPYKRLFRPYHIIETGGVRVMFIGIITEAYLAALSN